MKYHQTLFALVIVFCFACKKASVTVASVNSDAPQNMQASHACPVIDPSDFVEHPTNPYFPLIPGTTFHYINKVLDGKSITSEHVKVMVTSDKKIILGVSCVVVHDAATVDGKISEDTYDWYAQDKHSNLWYFGENTKSRTDSGWSTEGSWQAGVNGGCAGIAMWAHPEQHLGQRYYQEFLKGEAEDQAEVVDTNGTAKVYYGTFTHCIVTKETTRLEPGVVEHKYYYAGVGQVLTTLTKGGKEREELINITH